MNICMNTLLLLALLKNWVGFILRFIKSVKVILMLNLEFKPR
jgi:hypothetical protein